jgi:CheY-specific phosphatase CheX
VLRDELAQALATFATSTIDTLRETLGIEASFRGHGREAARIAVAIDVTGDLRRVTWVFPVELARELAHRMTGEPAPDDDAAIELANILTGRGAASLEDRGLRIELATPRITSGPIVGAAIRLVTAAGLIEIAFEPQRVAA